MAVRQASIDCAAAGFMRRELTESKSIQHVTCDQPAGCGREET